MSWHGSAWRGKGAAWAVVLGGSLIALATVAAFGNSFTGPFVFDDEPAIVDNPTIGHVWPIGETLSPPNHGETVSGRPLLNLSFAVNYTISGLDVWSYHVMNVVIHVLGVLLLFGVVRRTFLLPSMRAQWGSAAMPLALTVALLWAIHPLQTESVTYIVQRAESLVGLLYLLTLYCFVRGVGSARAMVWQTCAVLACLLGMASKEVMVSAPLMVLLYDRTFVAGSFREAWRRRYGFYLALAGTWLLLGWLVIATGNRGNTAGFGLKIHWWPYLGTQFGAIVHYLRLSVWPYPLVLDYGTETVHRSVEIVPYAIVIILLGLAVVLALWRWPKVGFLGAWFFAILAPTSSVVPVVTQTVAEHRMYLPLAAVLTGLAVGGHLTGQRLVRREKMSLSGLQLAEILLVMCVAIAFGILTFHRNKDYSNALSLWQNTVAQATHNARAHNNLGKALIREGRADEAIAHFLRSIELDPDYELALNNLGAALAERGQVDEAIAHYQRALEIKPDYAEAYNNLGNALFARGQFDDAVANCRKAVEIKPNYAEAQNNLGNALFRRGQSGEAIGHYRKALKMRPEYAEAYSNLGAALSQQGRFDEAIPYYQKAMQLKPEYLESRQNLNVSLSRREELVTALAERRGLIRLRPDDTALLNDTAWTLATNPNASVRNGAEAVELSERAVKLSRGEDPAILDTLAAAYAETDQCVKAVQTAQKALTLASSQNKTALSDALRERIAIYESGSPYRGDTPPPSASVKTPRLFLDTR